MQKNKNKLLDFLKKIEISRIQLTASDFFISIPPEFITMEDLSYTFEHKCRHAVIPTSLKDQNPNSEIFCFVQTFVSSKLDSRLKLSKAVKKDVAFSGSCRFVVRYLVDKNEKLEDGLLQELTKNFAIAHAYPYIRNHVENQFSQMGLIGFTLPLYRANPKLSPAIVEKPAT